MIVEAPLWVVSSAYWAMLSFESWQIYIFCDLIFINVLVMVHPLHYVTLITGFVLNRSLSPAHSTLVWTLFMLFYVLGFAKHVESRAHFLAPFPATRKWLLAWHFMKVMEAAAHSFNWRPLFNMSLVVLIRLRIGYCCTLFILLILWGVFYLRQRLGCRVHAAWLWDAAAAYSCGTLRFMDTTEAVHFLFLRRNVGSCLVITCIVIIKVHLIIILCRGRGEDHLVELADLCS